MLQVMRGDEVIECDWFQTMEHLQEIDLSSNKLRQFPEHLAGCPQLTELRLIHNNLEEIPLAFLKSANMRSNLRVFVLNDNPLIELPAEIGLLSNLQILGIARTKIQKLPN